MIVTSTEMLHTKINCAVNMHNL